MEVDAFLQEAVAAFQRGDLARARELTEQLVADSQTAQAAHLMGFIECRSGHLDAGVEWLTRALDAESDNLAYRIVLARALLDSERYGEALQVAQPPAGRSPRELALWHMRAAAADGARDWNASADAWAVLCDAGASDWRMWHNFGLALGQLGRWPEAAQALRRVVEANPEDHSLRRLLSTALSRAGRHEESADELSRSLEFSDEDVAGHVTLARMLADLRRAEEAEARMRRAALLVGAAEFDGSLEVLLALAAGPDRSQPEVATLRELALFLEGTNRWEALGRMVDAVEQRGIAPHRLGYPAAAAALRAGKAKKAQRILSAQSPEIDPLRWHWLMGRVADALEDANLAFGEAKAMNLSQPAYEAWRARGKRHLQAVRELGESISAEWVAGLEPLSSDGRRAPAFLVGFPRSGTTLLDTFLMGHPATAVLEEVPLLDAAQRMLGPSAELPSRTKAQLEQARNAYFDELRRHVDADFGGLVVDKMPLNMLAAPLLHCLFPEAHFIFAQRHPCDVVLSCFMQAFAMNDSMACFLELETAADYYDAAMNLWTRSAELLPLKVHTLVYEDLVADPESTLRPLVRFLGLDWRDELLDHRATASARSVIGTPSYNQVTEVLTRAPAGRWKKYRKQLEPVLPILLPWAERLGYSD